MSDYTRTPYLNLYKPTPDADNDAWGGHLNANADTLDSTLNGLVVGAGGPWLQTSGGTVTGPVTLAAAPATASGTAIQALIDALPANGGTVMLAPNTVYNVAATITVSKPNVHLQGSASTTLRRNASLTTGQQVTASAAATNFIIEGFTIDGNSVVATSYFELAIAGNNSLVRNMQIINSRATGHLSLAGQNSRATGNTITGLGIDLGLQTGYGIWAVSHQTVLIDNNTITGTGIDGIGFDGEGSRVIGNSVSGCHCWAGGAGSQIGSYGGASAGNGAMIIGNTVGPGGSNMASGIELVAPNMLCCGNSLDSVQGLGILLIGNGATVTGNTLRNTPNTGFGDGIYVLAGVTDFVISGNRAFDDKVTKTMRWGISVVAGASDRYAIVGNLCSPNGGSGGVGVVDSGTGIHKTIMGNTGNADIIPTISVAATITFPVNPVVILTGTGTITGIATTNQAIGRTITIIPTGVCTFQGNGTTLGPNSVTTVAYTPVTATFANSLWYLR